MLSMCIKFRSLKCDLMLGYVEQLASESTIKLFRARWKTAPVEKSPGKKHKSNICQRRLSIMFMGTRRKRRTFHFSQLCCRVAWGILKQTLNCLGTKANAGWKMLDGKCSPNFRNLWVASNNLISFSFAFIFTLLSRGNIHYLMW